MLTYPRLVRANARNRFAQPGSKGPGNFVKMHIVHCVSSYWLLRVDFGPQFPHVAITHADKMHLRCQSPRATGQSQALDSWGDPLPHESQRLSIYPAEFRHLLSFGRRGVERVHLRDSDRLIDSRDSDKETENESQTPVNQMSLVSKVPRVSISTRQLKQTSQQMNLALQMTPFQQHRSIIFGIPHAVVSATDAVGPAISGLIPMPVVCTSPSRRRCL